VRDDLKVLARLLGLMRPYARWMALGAALALATTLANVALMAVAGWFIAAMAIAGAAGVLIDYFTPAALIRLFAILRTGGRYLERLATHEATFRLLAELRVWLYRRLEPLAPARLEAHRGADLLERLQADVETLQNAYLGLLVPAVVALAGAACVTLVLALYSRAIALLALALLLAAGVALPLLLRRAGERPGARLVHTRAALRSALLDGLQGMADLQVYGAAERQASEIGRLTARLCAEQRRLARLSGIAEGAVALCASLAMWGAVLLGITLLGSGALRPAELPLLAFLVLASFEAVGGLPLAFQRLGETLAAARRIFELVDAAPEIAEPRAPSPRPRDAGIALRGVRLRYADDAPWALDRLDLEVAAGGRVALLGPSGAGKTSVVQLLLRLREYQAGEVRLGGHDLRSYRGEELRRLIAVVSQDTYLFNATIRENLLIAAPQADAQALERAARAAQIHDFVAALPEGYDSQVGEAGVRLSAGQARRVAVARALLRDAPILLLDEPTENLDAATERALLADLERLMTGRSVLLITHKLGGMLERADEVLLLERGRVVERGRPAELRRTSARYARYRDDLIETAAAG
jgi:ATP-binding cassette subfamily C protein CydC